MSPIGWVIDNRFAVEAVLGSGGMAQVLAARHLELDLKVAVKVILAGKRHSEVHRLRLVREARMAAAIRSDHVVRVHDVVTTGPDAPYFVMECLAGETLAARLKRGPLSPAEAAAVIAQACEAVGEAHLAGIVHRDLKPSNLFLVSRLDRELFVKLLDFGIGQARDAFAADLTRTGELVASPGYASPEQLRSSDRVDERTDLWSLGVILYECVTGRSPFEGRTMTELASAILRDDPTPLPHDVAQQIGEIVRRCLQKSAERRFQNVSELASRLAELAPADAGRTLRYLGGLRGAEATQPGGSGSTASTLTLPPTFSRPPHRTGAQALRAAALAAMMLFGCLVADQSEVGASAEVVASPPTPRLAGGTAPTTTAESLIPVSVIAQPTAPLPNVLVPSTTVSSGTSSSSMRPRRPRAIPSAAPASNGVPDVATLPLNALIDGRE